MTDASPQQRGALVVWFVGLLVYLLAVFHRSSLAVAGLAATERFDISAAQLSTFTMLQLLVYTAMQIPVGLILDRFGSRRVMLTGLVTLTAAQTLFAVADTYAVALIARVIVGIGDAMIFVCLLRLVNTWFVPRRIPFFTQMTGVLGQLGAIIAAVPMTLALRELGGPRRTSLPQRSASSCWLHSCSSFATRQLSDPRAVRRCRSPRSDAAWASRGSTPAPGLGLWTHFTTQFSATTLGLLWGYPFFVRGENLSSGQAGALLTILVVAVMAAGPALAWFITRHPWHRSTLVLAIVSAIVVMWTIVLTWRGDAPFWLLVLLMVAVGVGGPASMIGFDFGRSFNPEHRMGAAIGIINQGGFFASLVLVIAIGIILDWRTPGSSTAYTPSAFRWAMSFQYVLWGIGLVQIWRYRVQVRAAIMRDEPEAYGRTRELG